MTYYIFSDRINAREMGHDLAILDGPIDSDESWMVGQRIAEVISEPIKATLSVNSGKDLRDAFLATNVTLFSLRLVTALEAAGVDNLQIYPAEILDPKLNRTTSDFRAVNIVGLVEAADMQKSSYDPTSEPPMAEFENIVLKTKLPKNLLIFRLAENPSFILIHETVKKVLDQQRWAGFQVKALDDETAY